MIVLPTDRDVVEHVMDPCPSCGEDPNDPTEHRRGCERTGTCAQFGPPWMDRPWHADADYLGGEPFTAEAWRRHMAEAHPGQARR